MNAFALVSLQRIQEFHLWPLNTSTPKPSLFNPQRSPSGIPRDDRVRPTDRHTPTKQKKKKHTRQNGILPYAFFLLVCVLCVVWSVDRRAQNAVGVLFFLLWVVFVWLVNYLPASKFLFQTNKLKDRKREVESPIPQPTPATPNVSPRHRPPSTAPRARSARKSTTFLGQKTDTHVRVRNNEHPARGHEDTETRWLVWCEGGATSPPWSTRPPLPNPTKAQIPFGDLCVRRAWEDWRGVRPRRCLFCC